MELSGILTGQALCVFSWMIAQYTWPGLEPRPLDPESSILTPSHNTSHNIINIYLSFNYQKSFKHNKIKFLVQRAKIDNKPRYNTCKKERTPQLKLP